MQKSPVRYRSTHAPLYCATSSPRTKTLSLASSSSANASLSASLTATSLTPLGVAYFRLLPKSGNDAAGRRRVLDRIEQDRVDESRREAGRTRCEITMTESGVTVNWTLVGMDSVRLRYHIW